MTLQPKLQRIPVPSMDDLRGQLAITMRKGQWDVILSAAYSHGATLLEIDDNEKIAAAYRKAEEVQE
jgi:hypothetical protein